MIYEHVISIFSMTEMLESLKQTIANLATYDNQVIVSEQMTDTRANFVKRT